AHEVTIGIVGKYIDLPDAYLSVTEALRHGGFANDAKVRVRWIQSDECDTPAGAEKALAGLDAICVPGGFGIRGIEGKLGALNYTRTKGIPTLGLCLGLQCMVIEYARNVVGIETASSSEFDPDTTAPVIATMAEQLSIVEGEGDLGGTMRLGTYESKLAEGSVVAGVYGATTISERHRHRYEVNTTYREQLAEAGLQFSGPSPCGARPHGKVVPVARVAVDRHPGGAGCARRRAAIARPRYPRGLCAGVAGEGRDRARPPWGAGRPGGGPRGPRRSTGDGERGSRR